MSQFRTISAKRDVLSVHETTAALIDLQSDFIHLLRDCFFFLRFARLLLLLLFAGDGKVRMSLE